jgi:hypothetical protein
MSPTMPGDDRGESREDSPAGSRSSEHPPTRAGEVGRHERRHDRLVVMIDDAAKAHLHDKLRAVRRALVWKLDGVSEYDVRRPATATGTNLLGLVKHNAVSDARYFGDVFDRPFPEPLARWGERDAWGHWANEDETRDDIIDLYHRVWSHTDATIDALDLDASGFVPWWDETVPLFNVMVHRLTDATRHAGHADILREGIDGVVGVDADTRPLHGRDRDYWTARCAEIERIARAAAPHDGR